MKQWILIVSMLFGASLSHAQADYPTKPIRIIVPVAAGSGADAASRFYGEILGRKLGQSVIVENRTGAEGLLGIQAVKAAPADGYTILLASSSPMAVNPVIFKSLPYDAFKDFKPVSGLFVSPAAIVVGGATPYRTIKDLAADLKKQNRPLSVGSYVAGYRLIGIWLGIAAGMETIQVPYKGGSQMVNDVMGGQLDAGVNDFSGVSEMHKAGRLRILAITGDKRDALLPDVPTMKESGYPDFETYAWSSFYMRSETPDAIVEKLAKAMHEIQMSDEGKAYQSSRPGSPLILGPKEMREFQIKEYERFKRVAREAKLEPQ